MKIGVFGVTANPPHLSHLRAIKEAAMKVDELWVTPVFNHAFGKQFIDYESRVDMLKLLLNGEKNSHIKIKELDKDFYEKYEKTVYSYNLLLDLKTMYPEHEFKLVIGADNYKPEVWQRFYEHEKLEKEFGLVIIEDKGCHSTQIREGFKSGQDMSEFVGKAINDYIYHNRLYEERLTCKM